jgi:monofunctional biosynthetic peptidoglycan transglycosylase
VSEDWAFYDHEGIDVNQIQVVVEESLEEGEFVRGASTITQQVVKNVFLSNERTLIRKFKEVILASSLEKEFSKDEILEFYFNLVELGDGIYGIKAASELYFQKHPKDLNGKEGAFLAMLLPSPKKYAQSFRQEGLTAFASEQIDNILIKLRQAKIINEDKRLELKSLPLSFEVINFIDEDLLSVENESYEAEENSQENDLLSR